MRLLPPAASRLSLAATLPLAVALAVAVPAATASATEAPQMGVGPAECVQPAPHTECGAAEVSYQPASGLKSPSRPSRTTTKGSGAKGEGETTTGSELPSAKPGDPFRFFSPASFWNTPLGDEPALDPASTPIVANFLAEIEAERNAGEDPTLNTKRWSVPLYTVPADQPTVQVEHNNGGTSRALSAAWTAVPLPPEAEPAAGSDRHLVVWQPSSDKLWEFWHLSNEGGVWSAPWGGAMEHVSTSEGVYGPSSWAGATTQWGGTASSLSLAGGLITLEDLEHGKIEHALAIGIPEVRAGVYSLPAQRTDGRSSDPLALPEGARLRIDPSLDLTTLNLPPLALEIARAAQEYGLIVRSIGSHVVFYGQTPPSSANPYTGKTGYFEGRDPADLLAGFPWERLQLLQMSLRPAG
ncbi:MAG TPA: hypothetical protein VG816_13525 [Solirubrobacterales bacterium]|nr:hypothetical protein [Solirubrobacterales bacterium]